MHSRTGFGFSGGNEVFSRFTRDRVLCVSIRARRHFTAPSEAALETRGGTSEWVRWGWPASERRPPGALWSLTMGWGRLGPGVGGPVLQLLAGRVACEVGLLPSVGWRQKP